jgi:hypothetical protein
MSFARLKSILCMVAMVGVPLIVMGCHSASSPPYPPPLDPVRFAGDARAITIEPDVVKLSIAGCRAVRNGLYVDVFVACEQSETVAELLGDVAVPYAKALFEMHNASGSVVAIRPAVRDSKDYHPLPLTFTLISALGGGSAPQIGPGGMAAQTYRVVPGVVIQTIPVGIEERLAPGAYSLRLTGEWAELAHSCSPRDRHALAEAMGGSRIVAEQSWHPFTAFIAVDSSRVTEGSTGTTVAVPVSVPEGVKYETTVPGGG